MDNPKNIGVRARVQVDSGDRKTPPRAVPKIFEEFEQQFTQWKEGSDNAARTPEPIPDPPKIPSNPRKYPFRPAALYNAMIAPLTSYAIKGVIWYQGETNADRAVQYRKLFPAMIRDWRRA